MIKVGVFWVSALLSVDIIFDVEEYHDDYQSEDMLITYSKQHKDVWKSFQGNNVVASIAFINLTLYHAVECGMIWKKNLTR